MFYPGSPAEKEVKLLISDQGYCIILLGDVNSNCQDCNEDKIGNVKQAEAILVVLDEEGDISGMAVLWEEICQNEEINWH